jgi:hypothetical protein
MKVEIVKVTNGLGEELYRAHSLDKNNTRIGTIGIANTLAGVEDHVRIYKLKSEITEHSVKTYEI